MPAAFARPSTGSAQALVALTVIMAGSETHPSELVPVTTYTAVAAGEAVIVFPENSPGLQVYVPAPLAVSVIFCPKQMRVSVATRVSTGVGDTFTCRVSVLLQPRLLVPVTEYTMLDKGVTEMVAPLVNPGFHVYVTAPVALNAAVFPSQI